MTQLSNTFNQIIFKETPASTVFFTHLACDLFYTVLLIVSLFFTNWSINLIRQLNPQSLQTVGITSLETNIEPNGQINYYVSYAVSTNNNTSSQAVSYQRKRIPAALYYELQDQSTFPVSVISEQPLETKVLPQALKHNAITNTVIPLIMTLIGLTAITVSGYLLTRSVIYSAQSIELNRYGVLTYGVIRKRSLEKFNDREPEYSLVYQFETTVNNETIQANQTVNHSRFSHTQIGEVIRVRYNPKKPHISRLEF